MNLPITFISPRLALQKGDFLGSGVPYWPIELATLTAYARDQGDTVHFIDLFGNDPTIITDADDHYLQGEPIENHIETDHFIKSKFVLIYAISYMSHTEILSIAEKLKSRFDSIRIAVLENSQAVTGYSLQPLAESFFQVGIDLIICGEAYFNWDEIKCKIMGDSSIPFPVNTISPDSNTFPQRITKKSFHYPIPAWDLINLSGYWSLPYSHGPKTKKFLPVLTSRGCPYPCNFCVIPETNNIRWRGNSPEDVVNELLYLRDHFDVHDFQIEDLNPTVQHKRWERICELLIENRANINFSFVSGTKAETVRIDKIPLFAQAGCRYISISPESGSKDTMKSIGKKFNYSHGLDLVAACRKNGIRTQACFLVGHPDELDVNVSASRSYLKDLVRSGLDEVAVFVVAPFAGSQLYKRDSIAMNNQTALTSFSPKGRKNYAELERSRKNLILTFFLGKFIFGIDLWKQGFRALFGTPQTKMENLPKRVAFIYYLEIRNRLSQIRANSQR